MSRRTPLRLALAWAALASLAGVAAAEEIQTRSGTVYEGKLLSETPTHYVLETRELGTLRIAKADVVEVRGPGREPAKAPPKPAEVAVAKPSEKPKAAAKGEGDPKEPAAPVDPAAEAAARAEAERRAAEAAAALDAAQRMERRKQTKIRRRTEPLPAAGAASPPPAEGPGAAAAASAPPAPGTPKAAPSAATNTASPSGAGGGSETPPEPEERPVLGGALLARTAPGTELVLFEPPRTFEPAPSGIELGRRTFARLDVVGTASAWLTTKIGDREERISVRLADVQRHVEVKNASHRIRMLEGVSQGDWLRLTLEDGSVIEGRLVGLDEGTAHLAATSPDGATSERTADMTRAVRLEGLLRNPLAQKSLSETELDEPIAVTTWPEGKMLAGRVVGHGNGTVRLDLDGDRSGDESVPVSAPLAEVRRIPGTAREKIREIKTGELVKVRGYEDYPDARIERTWTGPVESVTAFAICLRLDDGAAVVPFDSLVSLDKVLAGAHRNLGAAIVSPDESGLRVLPGMPPEESGSAPPGVSALNDGREVTHVYVAPPYEGSVFGVRVGRAVTEALSSTALEFTAEVLPKQDARGVRSKEISESVDGLRVVVYVSPQDVVSAVEISRR